MTAPATNAALPPLSAIRPCSRHAGVACPEQSRRNPETRTGSRTGLYYYRARMVDPALGRFMQTDPIGYYDSMNLYQYCGNNPVNYTDALGLISVAVYNGREQFLENAAQNAYMSKRVANPYAAAIYLQKVKSIGITIDKLYVIDHGGKQWLGYSKRRRAFLDPSSKEWKQMAGAVAEDGTIVLCGCSVASEIYSGGKSYLQALADSGGRTIIAFDDLVYPETGFTAGAYYKATPQKGKPEKIETDMGEYFGNGGVSGYTRMLVEYWRRRFLDKNIFW